MAIRAIFKNPVYLHGFWGGSRADCKHKGAYLLASYRIDVQHVCGSVGFEANCPPVWMELKGTTSFHLLKNILLFSPVGFKGNLSLLEIAEKKKKKTIRGLQQMEDRNIKRPIWWVQTEKKHRVKPSEPGVSGGHRLRGAAALRSGLAAMRPMFLFFAQAGQMELASSVF